MDLISLNEFQNSGNHLWACHNMRLSRRLEKSKGGWNEEIEEIITRRNNTYEAMSFEHNDHTYKAS